MHFQKILLTSCLISFSAFSFQPSFATTGTNTENTAQQRKAAYQHLLAHAKTISLQSKELASSQALLSPPPAENSKQFAYDKEQFISTRSLINTPRWEQATEEAQLFNGKVGSVFSKAAGIEISKENTPVTHQFLEDLLIISGFMGTEEAKNHYQRVRPFMYFHTHTCTPEDEELLKKDGSYPSGHSAFGWSTALILSEILPERQNQLLKEGYEFGQSRVICGAHWQSDVDAGRLIGSEIVARIHADKTYRHKLELVKQELQSKVQHSKQVVK